MTWDPGVPFRAEKALQHAEALSVACPECDVEIGVECRNLTTGGPLVGQPAHFRRLKAVVLPS